MTIIRKSKDGRYLSVDDPEFEEGALDCGCVGRCKCDDDDEKE